MCARPVGPPKAARVQRVQKVQKVQKVQRVVVSQLRGDEYKDSVTCFPSRPHRHSKPKAKNLGMCGE